MGESLNQPCRVQDYGPMGFKLLLSRGKIATSGKLKVLDE